MTIVAAKFDWDGGNRAKCQKHGVSIAEIEALCRQTPRIAPDLAHSNDEDRRIAIGRNATGRPMFVAFALRTVAGDTLIRPISARYMHRKEISRYEETHS